jgi:hypothetical protein
MTSGIAIAMLLAALPTITSNSNCPSASDIESHLSALLPGDGTPPGTALVNASSEALLIDLRSGTRLLETQRRVVVGSRCEERARAAAVVIATWWPVEPARTAHAEVMPTVSISGEPVRRLFISAGGFASMISDGITPGARVEVAWSPWSRDFGFRLSISGTAAQGGDLGRGQVIFRRATSEIGPSYSHGRLRLDGGLALSLVGVQGSGYTTNQKSSGTSMGATTGLRMAWAWSSMLPWLELRGILWPQSQRIYVIESAVNTQTTYAMPCAELQLGVGVAFSLF